MEVVYCREDEEVCECLANVLREYGVRFTYDLWEPTYFTLFIDDGALIIQAWHDAGSSTITIPLSVFKADVAGKLAQCGRHT